MNIKELAAKIIEKYDTDAAFRDAIDESPEFYRACIYECGMVDAATLDDTPEFLMLVDEVERQFFENEFK